MLNGSRITFILLLVSALLLGCQPEDGQALSFDSVFARYAAGELAKDDVVDAYRQTYPLDGSLSNNQAKTTLAYLQADLYQYGYSLYQFGDFTALNDLYSYFLDVEEYRISQRLDWANEDAISRYLASVGYFSHLFSDTNSATAYFNAAQQAALAYKGKVSDATLAQFDQSIAHLATVQAERYLNNRGLSVSLRSSRSKGVTANSTVTNKAVSACGTSCNRTILPMPRSGTGGSCTKCMTTCSYPVDSDGDGYIDSAESVTNETYDENYENIDGVCQYSAEKACKNDGKHWYQSDCMDKDEYDFVKNKATIDTSGTTLDGQLDSLVTNTDSPDPTIVDTGTDDIINDLDEDQKQKVQTDLVNTSPNPNGTTGCPVDTYSGCKVFSAQDSSGQANELISLTRNYKQFHDNDFSLGKYWSFAFDTRLVWGVDHSSVVSNSINTIQSYASGQQAIISAVDNAIDTIEGPPAVMDNSYFSNYISATYTNPWTQNYRDPAVLLKANYEALIPALNARIDTASARHQKNRYSGVGASDELALIGNQRIKWIAPNGSQMSFLETETGYEAEHHDYRLAVDGAGYQVTAPNGTVYRYNNWGLLTSIKDLQLNEVTVTRNASDPLKIQAVADQNGRTLAFSYGVGNDHRLDQVTDDAGRTLTYRYSRKGSETLLTEVVAFDGQVTTFDYAPYSQSYVDNRFGLNELKTKAAWLMSVRQHGGGARYFDYVWHAGKQHFVVSTQTDEVGNVWAYRYPSSTLTVVTDRSAKLDTYYTYEQNTGLLQSKEFVSLVSSDVASQSFRHDESRNQTQFTDENQHTTSTLYQDGKLAFRTRGELGQETFTYDGDQLQTLINGAGDLTHNDYDPVTGLLRFTSLPTDGQVDGNQVEYVYYGNSNRLKAKIQATSQGEFKTVYGYDLMGFVNSIKEYTPTSVQQPVAETTLVNDAIGRKRQVTDAAGRTTTYFYCDAHTETGADLLAECPANARDLNNPVRIELPPVETGLVDAYGLAATEQFAIRFYYDDVNRLTKKIDYTGVTTDYSYYASGDVHTKTETIPHPEGDIVRSWVYTYNAERKLATVLEKLSQDDVGRMTKYEYDFRQRLIRTVVMAAPSFLTETNIAEEYAYYSNGWLKEKRVATGLASQPFDTWSYTYYPSGLLKTELRPDGGATEYGYDGAGRLVWTEETIVHADGRVSIVSTNIKPTARGWAGETINEDGDVTRLTYAITGAELSRTINNAADNMAAITWQHTEVNHLGQALKTQLPTGEVIERQFNGVGELTYEENAIGDVTENRYDAMGRQTYQRQANGLETTWLYEQLADQLVVTRTQRDINMSKVKVGYERVERNYYDFLGRLIRTEQDVSATQLQPARTLAWDYLYNAQGLLGTIVYPEWAPDAAASCTSQTFVNAQARAASGCFLTTVYGYSDVGYLVTEVQPGGRIIDYNNLDALGRPATVTAPDGRTRSFRYNHRGQATNVTLPDGFSTQTIGYNSRGQQEQIIDPSIEQWQQAWAYTGAGRLASHQYLGNQSSVPALNKTEYRYNALGAVSEIKDPRGFTTTFAFDANGNPAGMTDAAQTFFAVESDPIGRETLRKDAMINGHAAVTTTQYLNGGRTVIITDDLGQQTTLNLNAFGELTSVIDAQGNAVHYAYNERGEQIAMWDQLNNAEYFALNTRGQVTRVLDTLQRETTMNYDAAGNLAAVNQPEVGTTAYQYDAANRLRFVTSAKGFAANDPRYTQEYRYNSNGDLWQAINELGQTTTYDINPAGRLESTTSPDQDTIAYQYNARGQMTQRMANYDASTQEQWAYYDDGRLKSIHNAHYTENYQYTPTGALDFVANTTLNQTINYTHDANNRRTGMITNDQAVVYQRDSLGRIEKLFDGEEQYTFGYDANDRLISKTSPNGTRDLTLYNERGETIAVVLQRAQTAQDSYDNGRIYGFDESFFFNYKRSDNVPTSIDITAFEVHLNHVQQALQEQFPEDGYVTEDLLVYQWNAAGNLIAKQYNEKFSFFYEYDAADRLTAAYEPEGLITRYQWDKNGNLASKTVRALHYHYEYNEANQLITSTTWRLEHTGNGNSKGNSNKNAHKNNGTQSDWDWHHHDQSHFFEYLWDTKVNLSQMQLVTQHQYDGNGHLIQETTTSADGLETQAYHHDVYGRLTGIDTQYGAQVRFDYDSRDRRIKSAQLGWSDTVNAAHQRTSANYAYTSLYDGRQELSQFNTVNNEQALYRQLTYLPNQVAGLYGQLLKQTLPQWQSAQFDATGWGKDLAPAMYFHSDYQNSTIKVTSVDANVQYRYGYTPMGQAYGFKHRYSNEQMTRTFTSHSPNRNVVQNLYTGKYAEPLTGLALMDARWYDAQKARFLQPDQYNHANLMLPKGAQSELMRYIGRSQSDLLRDPAQQMRYGYVSGNPLRWVDPLGLATDVERARTVLGLSPLDGDYQVTSKDTSNRTADGRFSLEGDYRIKLDGSSKPHKGTDLAASVGTPIQAPADGRVVYSDTNSSGDNVVIIVHADGIETRYRHLDNMDVEKGQRVEQGQKIAEVGVSGNVPVGSQAHLHFEIVIDNARYISPEEVYGYSQTAAPTPYSIPRALKEDMNEIKLRCENK